ncbi:MAG: glycosyltransferase family 2 protein [Candidatus Melainabacteria bacterium]|nr:glycosyltransferase family 2 protein [Candidatus Melainabacteria bacterium]
MELLREPHTLLGQDGLEPLVSVCLPVFNGEAYLGAALESILSQSLERFELIVVDDCSTDNSKEIMRQFARRDKRIVCHFNEKRLGLFGNYNLAMSLARAPYIKTFSQDDLLHPDCLMQGLSCLESFPQVSLVSFERQAIDSAGQCLKVEIPDLSACSAGFVVDEPIIGAEAILACLYPVTNYLGEPSAVMFRSEHRGSGFDPGFHQLGDLDFNLRLLLEGDCFYVPGPLCYFRLHDQSASTRNSLSLLAGLDIILMSRKYGYIFEEFGRSSEDFLDESVLAYAQYIDWMARTGTLSQAGLQVFQGQEEIFKADPEVLIRTAADFRALSFRALKLAAGKSAATRLSVAEQNRFDENQRFIEALEEKVRILLASRSWRLTRPLRELNRLLGSFAGAGETSLPSILSGDVLSQQREYIDRLHSIEQEIYGSRSWRWSLPLRRIKKRLSEVNP